jgi:choline dehydrogenase-like flavoprotein
MSQYYQRFRTIHSPPEAVRHRLHVEYIDGDERSRTSGPIDASFPISSEPLSEAWIETFRNLRCSVSDDLSSGNPIGGVTATCAITPGLQERSHAGNAYFNPAAHRPNLHLTAEALVHRVLLDTSRVGNIVATGVEYWSHGKKSTVRARREVIICAGAFQSPQILELSGIGSANLLKSHGIKSIYDNPDVGGMSCSCDAK